MADKCVRLDTPSTPGADGGAAGQLSDPVGSQELPAAGMHAVSAASTGGFAGGAAGQLSSLPAAMSSGGIGAIPAVDVSGAPSSGSAGDGSVPAAPAAPSGEPAAAGTASAPISPPSAADAGAAASEPAPPEPTCNPAAEQCDNADNDCDGAIDEDIEPRPCGMDVGECKPGTISCRAGQWDDEATRCSGEVKGSAERCDDKDNDCDGDTDEDVLNECGGCERLADPPGRSCSAGQFACEASGRYQCRGQNATECDAEARRGSADNQCDNNDNDCDGQVDEDGDNGCRGPCSARLNNKPGDRCTVRASGSSSSGCDLVGSWACDGTTSVRCEAPFDAPTVGECGCPWACNNAQTGESRVVVSQNQPDLGTEWLCVKVSPDCN